MARAPQGHPAGWKQGAQFVIQQSDDLSRAARGVAEVTLEGNALLQETTLLQMPVKP